MNMTSAIDRANSPSGAVGPPRVACPGARGASKFVTSGGLGLLIPVPVSVLDVPMTVVASAPPGG
jgi:hypothetical protein